MVSTTDPAEGHHQGIPPASCTERWVKLVQAGRQERICEQLGARGAYLRQHEVAVTTQRACCVATSQRMALLSSCVAILSKAEVRGRNRYCAGGVSVTAWSVPGASLKAASQDFQAPPPQAPASPLSSCLIINLQSRLMMISSESGQWWTSTDKCVCVLCCLQAPTSPTCCALT
jgi:hypothetical protein